MKRRQLLGFGLALVMLAASSCILISAQILTHFSLPNPFTIDSSLIDHAARIPVDLSVDVGKDYTDNKDKLKDIGDFAILGKFTNVNGPAGGVLVYITPDLVGPPGGAPGIPSNAVLLWGPGKIGPTGSVRTIGWDESAALFHPAGKALLLSEVKGDGQFTLYATGSAATFDIRVDDGLVVLLLDAGK